MQLFDKRKQMSICLRRGGNLLRNCITQSFTQDENILTHENASKIADTYGVTVEVLMLLAASHGLEFNAEEYVEYRTNTDERATKCEDINPNFTWDSRGDCTIL